MIIQTIKKKTVRNSTKKVEHFSPHFKKQFEGTWEKETEYQTNQIKIYFEQSKNYATVIDIGSGEAPPIKLKAFKNANKLLILPDQGNNYCVLEAKDDTLIFLIPANDKNAEVRIIFKRILD